MLSIYIDFLTLVWATFLILALPKLVYKERTLDNFLSIFIVSVYLLAQTGWTTSYFSGNLYGASFSNILWFFFNSAVLLMLTLKFKEK